MKRRSFLKATAAFIAAAFYGVGTVIAGAMPNRPDVYPLFGNGWSGLLRTMARKDAALYAEVEDMPFWLGVAYWRKRYPEDFYGIEMTTPADTAGPHLIKF